MFNNGSYVKATEKIYNLEDEFSTSWGPWAKLLETVILGYGTSNKSVIVKVSYFRRQNVQSAHFHFAAEGFAIRPVLLTATFFCLSELHESSTVPHSDTEEPDSSCTWLLVAVCSGCQQDVLATLSAI